MIYTQSDRMMFVQNAEGREVARIPLHNTDSNGEHPRELGEATASGSNANNGTWGERDVGGPVNFRAAMEDYEEMRKELSHLSKTRSTKTNATKRESSGLRRITTAGSRRSRATTNATGEAEPDLEAQGDDKPEEDDDDDFELGGFLKDGHFEKRQEGRSAKKVGVVYKNLTVKGVGATATFVKTLPSAILGVSHQQVCKLKINC